MSKNALITGVTGQDSAYLAELLRKLARADAAIVSPAYADSSPALQPWRNKSTAVRTGISDNHNAVDRTKAAAVRVRYRYRHMILRWAEDGLQGAGRRHPCGG